MLLKDMYTPEFLGHLAQVMKEVVPGFDRQRFLKSFEDPEWKGLELKGRMQFLARVLDGFLPAHFPDAVPVVADMTNRFKAKPFKGVGIEYMFLPEWIHHYGLDYFEESVVLMESVTPLTSCEFAVRPFIIRHKDRMLDVMLQWSRHSNEHVRRLASEGSRPRLPWAMALPELKRDPSPALPILENLKADPSEYVRRSVANHLNDISKDNPEVVLRIVKQWRNKSEETDALLRHACRSLLKAGRPDILKIFGLSHSDALIIAGFTLGSDKVKIGGKLPFSFKLANEGRRAKRVRIEYNIHYMKKNGITSKKIFKISERTIGPGEKIGIERAHSFSVITTRVLHPGQHAVSLVINGRETKAKMFRLLK